MPKANVEKLIHTAYFGDCGSSDPLAKERLMLEKIDELPQKFIDSIEKDGVLTPIEWNPRRNAVYNGHHRLVVAYLLGIVEIEYVENGSFELETEGQRNGLPEGRR